MSTAAAAVLLAAGVLASSVRLLRRERRSPQRPHPWRLALLLLGQGACALLLFLAMFPPPDRPVAETLVVATAGADASDLPAATGVRVVALPEAPADIEALRVPDLATALRRMPGVTRLRVVGAGLPDRDREVARRYSVEFDPPAPPAGVGELWWPQHVASGSAWPVTGRVDGVPGGAVELLDPSQNRVARAVLEEDGRFSLQAVARTPGRASYRLQLHDASEHVLEELELAVATEPGSPLRVLVLSGAPGPELKYLRRWVLDAGAELDSDIRLHPRASVVRSSPGVTAEALLETDVVILDERAWRSLGAAGRRTLTDAVLGGLGVVLRVTGPIADRERDELRALGFELRDSDARRDVRLVGVATPLARRPLRVDARDGVPLLRDQLGEPLALWRAAGRGRIALWWLSDSYRIVLDGAPTAYGKLWSDALATVARASGTRPPHIRGTEAGVNQRLVICGLSADASVAAPDERRVPLWPDATGCAAFWPATSGWHTLRTADVTGSFHVRTPGQARALQESGWRAGTTAIATDRAIDPGTLPGEGAPGSPWGFFLALLATLGATWWFERSRFGRGPAAAAASSPEPSG